jgi:hypothetical protein
MMTADQLCNAKQDIEGWEREIEAARDLIEDREEYIQQTMEQIREVTGCDCFAIGIPCPGHPKTP